MSRRIITLLCLSLFAAAPALAQLPPPAEAPQPPGPPATEPPATGAPQPLAPPANATGPGETQPNQAQPGEAQPEETQSGEAQPGRVFCGQNVTYKLSDPATLPEDGQRFLGVWSDAAWDANTCAALIVQDVKPDGTASIIYVFGPQGVDTPGPGGVLHGTGVIRDGELRFQDSDGSQFAFRPGVVDLQGHLIKPDGESFAATFKQTP